MSQVLRRTVIVLLVMIPGLTAIIGPLLTKAPSPRGAAFDPSAGIFGSDFAGRDVLREVLLGGVPIAITACAATLLCFLLAIPLGLAAAAGPRWIDELIMRPLDVLLAMPSLLLLILLASIAPQHGAVLIGIVVIILAPDAARVVRSAALTPARSSAFEAMLLTGEPWRHRVGWYVGRSIAGTVATDAGVRLIGALYLVASASFLGVGVDPAASNWGVMVEQNRGGMLVQSWATLLPALLITSLAVGLNLAIDEWSPRRHTRTSGLTSLPTKEKIIG